MICTSVIPCLSSGLAKNNKIIPENYVHVCPMLRAFMIILKV